MLSHPNVIGYFDSKVEDKALIISMEYASGGTLADYLQRQTSPLPESEVLHKFTQTVLGLDYIHSKKILHRDLKTQNMLLCANHKITKIGDFGISKVLMSKSKANTVVGSPSYLSPELCYGKPYNFCSDLWALGCVLYEMMALKRAFDAPNLPQLIQQIINGKFEPVPPTNFTSSLLFLVKCLLNLDPDKRPTTEALLERPMLIKHIVSLHTEIGALPYSGIFELAESTVQRAPQVVCYWSSTLGPLVLPQMKGTEISTVTLGTYTKMGATTDGQLVEWHLQHNTHRTHEFVCVPLETGDCVVDVASGEDFYMYITDCKVLSSGGVGLLGCLGHDSTADYSEPKVIQSIFGWEVRHIACGNRHTVICTADNEVFSWGLGHDGRLGTGTKDSFKSPQKIDLQEAVVQKIICGPDCSALISTQGEMFVTGRNFANKLCLDREGAQREALSFTKSVSLDDLYINKVCLSHCHSALLSSGMLYTVGSNTCLQLGRPTDSLEDAKVAMVIMEPGEDIVDISVGTESTLAVTSLGRVLKWGDEDLKPKALTLPLSKPKSIEGWGDQFMVVGEQ